MLQISDADMIQASADRTVTTRNEKMGREFGTLTVPGKRKYQLIWIYLLSAELPPCSVHVVQPFGQERGRDYLGYDFRIQRGALVGRGRNQTGNEPFRVSSK